MLKGEMVENLPLFHLEVAGVLEADEIDLDVPLARSLVRLLA
jgi:hypothetical protein